MEILKLELASNFSYPQFMSPPSRAKRIYMILSRPPFGGQYLIIGTKVSLPSP